MAGPSITSATRPAWIVGARYDLPLIVLTPLLALIGSAVCWFAVEQETVHGSLWLRVLGEVAVGIFLTALIQGHLVLVLVRAYLNPKVRQAHWRRFIWAPIVLVGIQVLSPWMCVTLSVLAVYWDVYHSGLQTFGFGRIYDARAGNDPLQGRSLDKVFNLIMYVAPILAGANLIEHVTTWRQFGLVGATGLAGIPELVVQARPMLVRVGVSVTLLGAIIYAAGLVRLRRQGYRMPLPKALLYCNTSVVAVLAWGFLDPLYAFFAMNTFHAVQYYAVVWAMESKGLMKRLAWQGRRNARALLLFLVVGATLAYGYVLPFVAELSGADPSARNLGYWSLVIMNAVSIMHFWFDGFIWSVRKKAV